MREKTRRKIKLAFVFGFVILATFTLFKPEAGAENVKKQPLPGKMVLDDPDNNNTENAGTQGKTPFDHEQHVAKDKCVTCHHTNSEKLTSAMEEEVKKCGACHTKEGTEKVINSKKAFHGKGTLIGCEGCHEDRSIEPMGCGSCHHKD
jgi:hypothetical protein